MGKKKVTRKKKLSKRIGTLGAGRQQSNFRLTTPVHEALEEIKDGIAEAVPQAPALHNRTFCLELCVYHALNSLRSGAISYRDLFETPVQIKKKKVKYTA